MTVHDELIFEVSRSADIDAFILTLTHCMQTVVGRRLQLIVPLPINIQIGSCWGSLQDYQAGGRMIVSEGNAPQLASAASSSVAGTVSAGTVSASAYTGVQTDPSLSRPFFQKRSLD